MNKPSLYETCSKCGKPQGYSPPSDMCASCDFYERRDQSKKDIVIKESDLK